MIRLLVSCVCLCVVWAGFNTAQAQDFVFSVPNLTIQSTTIADVPVTLDVITMPAAGWSFGICSNPSAVSPQMIVLGADAATANGGGAPGFVSDNVLPDGVTSGVVVDLFGVNMLPVSNNNEVAVITYGLTVGPGIMVPLEFCGTLGSPQVTTVVVSGGVSFSPLTNNGSLTIDIMGPDFKFSVPPAGGGYDPASGSLGGSVALTIEEEGTSMGFPNSTFGFSMAISHDDALLGDPAVTPGAGLSSLNGGSGPDFFAADSMDGLTAIGSIYSLANPTESLQFPAAEVVADLTFSNFDPSLIGGMDPVDTDIEWVFVAGSPGVTNSVAVDFSGTLVPASLEDGVLTLAPGGSLLVRGDCNGDQAVNIADIINLLDVLFANGPEPQCNKACDFNDDGQRNIADGIFLLSFLFAPNAPAPDAPFPGCGSDPTPDSLTCVTATCP